MAMILSRPRIMNIKLNGHPHEIPAPMTVRDLLDQIGFGEKPCVVELNEEAIFPREYSERMVQDGAKVEVVTLAAGG